MTRTNSDDYVSTLSIYNLHYLFEAMLVRLGADILICPEISKNTNFSLIFN